MLKNNKWIVVGHVDEIMMKGKNQTMFFDKLLLNLRRVNPEGAARRGGGKVLAENPAWNGFTDLQNILAEWILLPGLANIYPAVKCATDLSEIAKAAAEILRLSGARTFKIETARIWKEFSLTSPELSRAVGAAVLRALPEISVDVQEPELIVKIEVDRPYTLVLGKKHEGVGGLPVGVSGKVMCLLSGGIDSPAAAFLMMKRGAEAVLLHFENQTSARREVRSKIVRLAEKLARVQGQTKLIIVPFGELQKHVVADCPADLRMLIYRRLMLRIAERFARKEKCGALATGDSLSQVASQTLENLAVVYSATNMLKFAPLIGFNKVEIRALADKIGTLSISEEPYDDCCNLLVAKHPQTHASMKQIEAVEQGIDFEPHIDAAMENAMMKWVSPRSPVNGQE